MQLANNSSDATNDIDITAGFCKDSTNAVALTTTSTFVKRIDASWAAGTGNGGLSSSLTLTNDTWYHVFAILVSGSVDFGFDTSVTAANLVTDHSATAYRRIGSILYGTATIEPFVQRGDDFLWSGVHLDAQLTSVSTSRTALSLTTPQGIRTKAILAVQIRDESQIVQGWIRDADFTTVSPSTTRDFYVDGAGTNTSNAAGLRMDIWTNTSRQIFYRFNVSTVGNFTVATLGWNDPRGVYG